VAAYVENVLSCRLKGYGGAIFACVGRWTRRFSRRSRVAVSVRGLPAPWHARVWQCVLEAINALVLCPCFMSRCGVLKNLSIPDQVAVGSDFFHGCMLFDSENSCGFVVIVKNELGIVTPTRET
jgi:hypothetical protein